MEKYRKYFTVDPLKGSVSPGNSMQISIKFNPNGDEGIDSKTSSELRILHWIRVSATCTLKGGYMPLLAYNSNGIQVVQVELKARVLT